MVHGRVNGALRTETAFGGVLGAGRREAGVVRRVRHTADRLVF